MIGFRVRNYRSGVIVTANGQKLRLKENQVVTLRVKMAGIPCGYEDLVNVPVVSVFGYKSKGSLGNTGGFLRVQSGSAWLGFSGNAIISIA